MLGLCSCSNSRSGEDTQRFCRYFVCCKGVSLQLFAELLAGITPEGCGAPVSVLTTAVRPAGAPKRNHSCPDTRTRRTRHHVDCSPCSDLLWGRSLEFKQPAYAAASAASARTSRAADCAAGAFRCFPRSTPACQPTESPVSGVDRSAQYFLSRVRDRLRACFSRLLNVG